MLFNIKHLFNKQTAGEALTEDEQRVFDEEQARIIAALPDDDDDETLTAEQIEAKRIADEAASKAKPATAAEVAQELFKLNQKAAQDEKLEEERRKAAIEAGKASEGESLADMRSRYMALRKTARDEGDDDAAEAADILQLEIAEKSATEAVKRQYGTQLDASASIAEKNTYNTAIAGLSQEEVVEFDNYIKENRIKLVDLNNPVVADLIRTKAEKIVYDKTGGFAEKKVPGAESSISRGDSNLGREGNAIVEGFVKMASNLSKNQKKPIKIDRNELAGRNN